MRPGDAAAAGVAGAAGDAGEQCLEGASAGAAVKAGDLVAGGGLDAVHWCDLESMLEFG